MSVFIRPLHSQTALTCPTISTPSPLSCSDTNPIHETPVVAGDMVWLDVERTNGGNEGIPADASIRWSVLLKDCTPTG